MPASAWPLGIAHEGATESFRQ
eukprot:ctg_7376.g538